MKTTKSIMATLGAALLLSGCATQTALVNSSPKLNNAPQTAAYSKSQSFYVSGIGQQKTIDAAEVCNGADKVAKVSSSQQPKDILLGLVTLGIYTPRTAEVFCR
ncbi:lipoprotein bor [Moraxella caviae]|uniref:Lipoprotein bor n=1 Tax=Moraxella caviae TaxID=34060 RepID=A0A1T0ADR5_9GAMM|nr:Bor family protein [Moraxella caviae]OOR93875.1 lipoprotein bor [Moraxella caviae]STZ14115.1 Uncharacterized lipoprotein [Moraxella caviae]